MVHFPAGSVVVGLDGSPSSDAALMWAVEEAVRRTIPLHLMHARADEGWWIRSGAFPPAELEDRPDPVLSAGLLLAQERGPDLDLTWESADTTAAAALVARSSRADLVVVGSRGRSALRGVLLGSVSRQVAAHAECPVVVVHDEAYRLREQGRIVVGVDASATSSRAVEFAFAHAARRSMSVTAVYAWWSDAEEDLSRSDDERADVLVSKQQRMVSNALAVWREEYPNVPVRERVVRSHPADALVAASAAAQLLVVGRRGSGGFRGLVLGSVSHSVLHRSHCPVAVVNPRQE